MLHKQRMIGVALARKYGASRTVDAIRAGECFPQILRIAQCEVGTSTLVKALSEADGWYWAYKALCHVSELTKDQQSTLVAAIVKAEHWYGAGITLRDVWELTHENRAQLETIYQVAA